MSNLHDNKLKPFIHVFFVSPAYFSRSWSRCFFSILSCSIYSQLTHTEPPCSCVLYIDANHDACNFKQQENPHREGNWQLLLMRLQIWILLSMLCFFFKWGVWILSDQLYYRLQPLSSNNSLLFWIQRTITVLVVDDSFLRCMFGSVHME